MHRLSAAVFWLAAASLAWTQALYGPFLVLLRRLRGGEDAVPAAPAAPSRTCR